MMILALDSSAALSLFPGYGDDRVQALIEEADDVVVSALCRPEVSVVLDEVVADSLSAQRIADKVGRLWETFWVVPVDGECLDLATDLAVSYGIPLSPAIHLAAFDRIERPLRFVTLDGRQAAAAADLGFEVDQVKVARSAHEMLQA